jgi:hypothetical protein
MLDEVETKNLPLLQKLERAPEKRSASARRCRAKRPFNRNARQQLVLYAPVNSSNSFAVSERLSVHVPCPKTSARSPSVITAKWCCFAAACGGFRLQVFGMFSARPPYPSPSRIGCPAELSSRDIRILYHARVATAAGKVLLYRTRREEVGCRQLDGATAVGSKG